jgi:hexosaminidase
MAMESRYRKFMKIGQPAEANKYRLVDPNDLSKYLSVQLFSGNAMSPCIESTYTFVQKIVTEIKAMHDSAGQPLKTFHFGGDEVPKNAWSKKSISCDKLGFTGTSSEIKNSMTKYFLQRVSKITQTNGLNLQGWEDGLIDGNGIPFSRRLLQNNDVTGNIWDNVWEWGMAKRAYNSANAGYKVYSLNVIIFIFIMR